MAKSNKVKSAALAGLFAMVLFVHAPTSAASTAIVAPSSALGGIDAVHYVADSGETNDVAITVSGFDFTIVDPGATISVGPGCASVSASEVTCSLDFEVHVEVRLGDGNDALSLAGDIEEGSGAYFGAGGNDTILGFGGPFSFEHLRGGPGNDVLRGRGGGDTLDGGSGADLMSGGTSTSCEFLGCFPPDDTVTYANRSDPVFADADGVADDGEVSEGDLIKRDVEVIRGGSGDDVLGGETINVRTFTGGGKFRYGMELWGNRGDDVLRGWRSSDYLLGGKGNDVLRGDGSNDGLAGGRGNDQLVGGHGRDHLSGGWGRDRLFARDGKPDRVGGGRGRDEASIDRGLDRLRRVEELF
ncbi:MAG TPA: calcium-binding protein [Gaiellaceae bacterium]|nr:calcium-binding protein [Gaiellaceae bacterium]